MTELWIRIDPEAQPSLIAQDRDLTLTEMQEAVGGLIEYCTFGRNVKLPVPSPQGGAMVWGEVIDVIAHEEGRLVNNPLPNAVATYAAFGQSIADAPYSIVGAVLVHVRIPDGAQEATMQELLSLILGAEVAQAMTDALEEANYGDDE